MPSINTADQNPWGYRRFFRLFRRREKAPLIDVTYSYQYMMRFPRLPITVPPLVPTLMSYRWNDEDNYKLSPKKFLRSHHHHHPQQQPIRRRFSKRYSDIVGPASTRIYLPRRESFLQEKQLSFSKQNRTSFKRNPNENFYIFNSQNKKSTDIHYSLIKEKKSEQPTTTRRYNNNNNNNNKNRRLSTINAVDLLAHRMQVAMSTELMHSLDRNFVFNEKKQQSVNRSHSLFISKQDWEEKKESYPYLIPRVKYSPKTEQKTISIDEPTPDYEEDEEDKVEEEEIIIRPIKNLEIGEEPTVDYDEPNFTSTYELEETSRTPEDLGVSSSFIAPLTSMTPTSENQSSIPPTPPPLPITINEENKVQFRCRTIADQITPNHKLTLKDEIDTKTNTIEDKPTETYSSKIIPQNSKPYYLNISKELLEKTTLRKVSQPVSRSYSTYGSITQINDHPTEITTLCEKTSTINEQQSLDDLSSSATNSIIIENEYEHKKSSKIYNDYKRRASLINLPITNSSNPSAIIHPIHKHIGLRSSTSSSSAANEKLNDMNICVINQLNQHLTTRFNKQQEISLKKPTNSIKQEKTNIYDEPQNPEISSPSIPPPPPPLPVGGFRTIQTQLNRPISSQRTSVITLTRETNSTGTSTTSSKLSDTRILRELRTNPLFTKAKEHLEVINTEQTNSYVKLDTCTKTSKNIETFIMRPDEINPKKQSELELIFQKRAQRNLT